MRRKLTGLTLGLALGVAPLAGQAAILYATSNFGTDNLWRLDTTTQTMTFIGDTGLDANFGLADRNGKLYGFDQTGTNAVKEVSLTTGATLNTYNVGISTAGEGSIAFNSAGTGYLAQCSGGNLWSFDITGPSSSFLANTGPCFDGLDFNSSNVLYGLQQSTGSLYTINTTNGATTLVGATPFSAGNLAGLSFDSSDNLYAITSAGALWSVNAASPGSSTLLWNTGLSAVSGLSAINAVPEPATLALLGLGLAGLGFSRRRKA